MFLMLLFSYFWFHATGLEQTRMEGPQHDALFCFSRSLVYTWKHHILHVHNSAGCPPQDKHQSDFVSVIHLLSDWRMAALYVEVNKFDYFMSVSPAK